MSSAGKKAGITPAMINAGIDVLRASDYGCELRFETDQDLVVRIYATMTAAEKCSPENICKEHVDTR